MVASVAVIIVNYGTADLAIAAAQSVLDRQHGGRRVTVHLVDNASPGEDAQTLRDAHVKYGWGDRVRLWLEATNHGFGRGNNVVLDALVLRDDPPDAAFLLNPDARLENEAIDLLSTALESDSGAVAAGAGLRRSDRSRTTAAFRFPGWLSEIARITDFGPLDRLLSTSRVPLPPEHPAGPVDWVTGAAVMLRFAAAQRAGFFDPGFFLYYEEVDLMRRMTAAGGRVLYVPQAQVLHEEGVATGQFAGATGRKRDPDYLYRSWAHYFAGAFGRPRALMLALTLWPAALANVVHRRLRGKAPTIPRRFFRDHVRLVILPLLTGRSA